MGELEASSDRGPTNTEETVVTVPAMVEPTEAESTPVAIGPQHRDAPIQVDLSD